MSDRRKQILFDQTQNERGRLDSTYSQLGQILKDNDFDAEPYTDFMILAKNLVNANVIVFACPNSSKLRPAEIDTIKHFVQEGGGLMLLSLSGGDKGLMNNMSLLSKGFGIDFDNTAVKDERSNAGLPTMPLIRDIMPHPSTEGIDSLVIPSSCSLKLSGSAVAIAMTSPTADPAGAPVIAVAEFGKGRVICVGSYEVFRRGGGLKHENNSLFAVSAFRWLSGDFKVTLPSKVAAKQEAAERTPAAAGRTASSASAEVEQTMRRLVNAVFDLQKDISKVTDRISQVDDNILKLRGQFQDFAEKTQSQLGVVIPVKQFRSDEEKRAAQVEGDIRALEKEAESIGQLRDHLEQKLASGALPRETYEEQIQNLEMKLASVTKRIEKKQKEVGQSTS